MKIKPIISIVAIASILLLTGCGWSGGYRYPCQDPKNWELPECKPPLCVPDGWCTKDIIGIDLSTIDPVTGEPLETVVVDPTTTEESTNE